MRIKERKSGRVGEREMGRWGEAQSKEFPLSECPCVRVSSSPHPRTPAPLLRLSIFCCCCLLLVGCQSTPVPSGRTVTVQVQRVVSGQTLDVVNPTQQRAVIERVRLIGIEAPDLKQEPWGSAAKNRFEQMISQTPDHNQQIVLQPVVLEPDVQEKDSTGRWLAYVWYDGVLINEQLVKQGYVIAAPRSPNKKYDERFARAQEYARLMGYGIWNPDQPMRLTPAEFRRQNP